jgi:outer membrane receptor protein involved in Fe transport
MSGTAVVILAALAAAQPEGQAAAAPVAPAEQGVIAYPPSFFADSGAATALEMVARVPGFTFDKGTVVRGLSGSGGNVLVDGEWPVSKNDTIEEILKRIPASGVARIEVIRGGAPGVDMQGRSVLANIVRTSTSGGRGSALVSSQALGDGRVLNSFRAEGQWRWGRRAAELAVVYGRGPDDLLGDGPRVRFAPDGSVILASDVDADAQGFRKWVTGAFETPAGAGKLRLNGAYMLSPYSAETYDRYITQPGREYQYTTLDRLQAELGARYSRPLGAATTLEALLFQQWNNVDTEDRFDGLTVDRDFRLDKHVTETVGRLHLRRTLSPSLTVEGGVEGAFNALESTTAFIQNGVRVRLPAANVTVEEKRAEPFAAATWRPAASLTLEAGLKRESSTVSSEGDVVLEKSLSFWKPRAALTWAPDGRRQVRVRVEREVSQLNFDDFVASSNLVNTGSVQVGNPDLSPQQAWVLEAAYEHRFWGSGAVVATLRHSELTDVIDRAPVFGAGGAVADAPGNIGDGTKDEAILSLTVPLDRLGVKAGQFKAQGTWRESEVVDPTTGSAREISALRPVEWELHFSQDLPDWRATWGVDVSLAYRESYYRLTEIETRKLDPWVVVYADIKPRRDLILRLELQNIGARGVTRIREVYAGPRDAAPLLYTDVRDLDFNPMIFVRLRKAFG